MGPFDMSLMKGKKKKSFSRNRQGRLLKTDG